MDSTNHSDLLGDLGSKFGGHFRFTSRTPYIEPEYGIAFILYQEGDN